MRFNRHGAVKRTMRRLTRLIAVKVWPAIFEDFVRLSVTLTGCVEATADHAQPVPGPADRPDDLPPGHPERLVPEVQMDEVERGLWSQLPIQLTTSPEEVDGPSQEAG